MTAEPGSGTDAAACGCSTGAARDRRSDRAVRFAREADLAELAGIEDAADRLLIDRLQPTGWLPAPPGSLRAAAPGFLLVATAPHGGTAVGFAHVLEHAGQAHLEQLSVLPEHQRQGLGRALAVAALTEAGIRGHARITLRTFADVPWNAPFYRTLGFRELEPDTDFQRSLVRTEEQVGLLGLGPRVLMVADLPRGRAV